jgi:hypothetical protein
MEGTVGRQNLDVGLLGRVVVGEDGVEVTAAQVAQPLPE